MLGVCPADPVRDPKEKVFNGADSRTSNVVCFIHIAAPPLSKKADHANNGVYKNNRGLYRSIGPE
jgi:hypothetical protein